MGRYTALFERLMSNEKHISSTNEDLACNVSLLDNAILNRQSCHSFVTQKCLICGKEWVSNLPCSDKICLECSHKRSRKHSYTIFSLLAALGLLNRANRLKFVTLTIKNVSSVAEGYKILRHCFGILQHRAIWYKSFYGRKNKNGKRRKGWNVRGGCGNFETTNKMLGRGYHVHLHLLVDADFIPQKQLSKLWFEITGNSKVVDVRSCSGTKEAIYEISKYSFKPADADLWSDIMREDFNAALHGKVLFFRFGSWRKVIFKERAAKCSFCGSDCIVTLEFETDYVRDKINNPILVYGAGEYG